MHEHPAPARPDRILLFLGIGAIVFLAGAVGYRYVSREPLTPEAGVVLRRLDEQIAQLTNQLEETTAGLGRLDEDPNIALQASQALRAEADRLEAVVQETNQLGKVIRKKRVKRSAFAAAEQAEAAATQARAVAAQISGYAQEGAASGFAPTDIISGLRDTRLSLDAADTALVVAMEAVE